VTTYRDQFATEVRNTGIDGLIETISAKNRTLESSMQKAEKK
jgi:phospholipid transport system substrate-binding protein